MDVGGKFQEILSPEFLLSSRKPFSQFSFQDLSPELGLREGLHEGYRCGFFVAGQVGFAEIDDLGLGQFLFFFNDHHCFDGFPPFIVGHPDDHRFGCRARNETG